MATNGKVVIDVEIEHVWLDESSVLTLDLKTRSGPVVVAVQRGRAIRDETPIEVAAALDLIRAVLYTERGDPGLMAHAQNALIEPTQVVRKYLEGRGLYGPPYSL